MFYKVVVLIALCRNCAVQSATHHYRPLRYTIPQPLIQAFSPQGLQGNINKPPDGSEKYLLDEVVKEKDGERWAYKNSTVKLHVGDKIYYTVFVLKGNLGYRLQDRAQEITDLLPLDHVGVKPSSTTHSPPPAVSPPAADCTICKNVVSNITQELFDLQEEVEFQREMNDILKDLVKKHPQTSRTLALDGVNVTDDELVVIVQGIISDKLHLTFKVHNVTRTKRGMVKFYVDSLEEKLQVVMTAKRQLKYSRFKIIY